MTEHAQADRILEAQGGILVEVDQSKPFRVDEDGLLHFRVRNLTAEAGRLTLRVRIARVDLLRGDATIDLRPNRVHDIRFPLSSKVPGEKLVEQLDVDFVLKGTRYQLALPDHGVTLYMAPESGAGGRIDLSGVSFDFRDHVGDVVLRNVIADQDRAVPVRDREDWKALALVPRPAGQIIARGHRRPGLTDLALIGPWLPSGAQVRAFLFARSDLPFGASHGRKGKDVPLTLRRMPCESRERDSANFFLNDLVSGLHGRFALKKGKLCVRDEGSLNGTRLNRRKLPARTWVSLPTSFRLDLTAETDVLTLAGRLFRPTEALHALTLRAPASGVHGASVEVGAELGLPVEALRLRRQGNVTEHLYVQVLSQATVGTTADCALRFKGEGIRSRHASVVFYRGEWLLRALTGDGITLVDGQPVGADEYFTLGPGQTVVLGSLEFKVRKVTRELLTRL